MRKARIILGVVVLGGLVAAGGCRSAADPVYTTTAVRLQPDGTQTVTQGKITLSEELRQNAARAAARENEYPGLGTAADAIGTDGACNFQDLWIYDQASYTGNRICFVGAGIADLSAYLDYCLFYLGHGHCYTWQQTATSYLGGIDSGSFEAAAPICGGSPVTPCASFQAWQSSTNLGSCAGSRYLNPDGACNCPTGDTLCGSTCVDTSTDSSNCGSCGHACTAPETCSGGSCVCASPDTLCGSSCVNTSTDPNNCGSCGHVCSVAHGTAACSGGTCVVASCTAPYANCDGSYANGCETNTGTDANNCGACSQACGTGQSCGGGYCSCGGSSDCSGLGPNTQCCTDPNSANHDLCINVNNGCSCGNPCYGGLAGPSPCTLECCTGPNDVAQCVSSCGGAVPVRLTCP